VSSCSPPRFRALFVMIGIAMAVQRNEGIGRG
jgi:hypothetical protein